ncbi:MAG: Stk1 family PASTA domain-containing Ser/Thr kinase [Ruminococcaceae bacterium]|nr:Stk1 family PASTA domain-containing Ser/Thr kinase [Oscillospiraceae bacterium]
MDKFVGKRLDGRYEIREIIGVGGMAVVYKAYDCIEDRIVAVKILKEEFISNEEFINRFKNESKAIAVLNHPNIVKVYDVSFGDLIQYIVMEYVDGITLKQYINQQTDMRWKDAVYLTIQVLRALQHAHDKGIVHRDVKPQNIMLLADGTIKVTDFGIARFARSQHKTMTDKAIGSVHYISPEQARGEQTDEKADIYSVGVMLYEMLTGRLPFEAESAVSVAIMQLQKDPVLPRNINETIPLGLEQITMHAMQKDFNKRYRSAAEMLRDLEEFRRSPDMEFAYTYFVDDEPTKFVDAAGIGNVKSAENADIDTAEEEEDDEKSPVIPILAGIAIAFIIAAIIVAVIIWYMWGIRTDSVTVPNFVGLTQSQLVDDPQYDDYNFEFVRQYSDTVPEGKVISQSYVEGRVIKKTQKIVITLSMGPEVSVMPNLYNLDVTTAQQELRARGLNYKLIYDTHTIVAKNYVITTSPAADSPITKGDEVLIYVSLGQEVTYLSETEMQRLNCIGYNVNDAKAIIESLGLTVEILYDDDAMPAGTVISQTPSSDSTTQVARGSTVTIVVSTGIVSFDYSLTVSDLPKNFKSEYKDMTMSVWMNGVQVTATSAFDANTAKPWSFNLNSATETAEVIIKLNFVNASANSLNGDAGAFIYTVDFKNGSATLKPGSYNITADMLETAVAE